MASDINFIKTEDSLLFEKIKSKKDISSEDDFEGYFIDADEKEIRKITESLKNTKRKQIAILARDETFNRRVIETLKFDYLVSPEINFGKDSLKQRSSGLNHVLVKEAAKKNIAILVSLDNLMKFEKKEKAVLIARIIQNVVLCRKTNCSIKIASFSDKFSLSKLERERIAFSFGMSSQQVKNSCSF